MSYYVTTPIYYVNAEPHLGHAYSTVAADVLARHMRQRGEDVFFLTGTDEHGEPVAQAAARAGTTPRELADLNSERFRALTARIGASNDFFIRTSDPEHGAAVQRVLQAVHDAGYVYPGTYEGWYCPRCADFKTDAELVDGNRCPIHLIVLEREREDNYFFRLSAFQEPLERLYEERPQFVQPRIRYNEALSFIKSGLNDVSLTRPKISWGVPVPWDPEQVFYVWFDALLNYYTALSYARPGEDLTDRYWPADVHVIGKDILKFHAVFWPALLMAASLELPERIFIHGYLLMDEHKMSKSLGNVIDPFERRRHLRCRRAALLPDGGRRLRPGRQRLDRGLRGALLGGARQPVRQPRKPDHRHGPALSRRCRAGRRRSADELRLFDGLVEEVKQDFDDVQVTQALGRIWALVRRLNQYVQERQPWQLAKDEGAAGELDTILYTLAEGLRVAAVLVHPFMPESSERLLAALSSEDLSLEAARLGARPGGNEVAGLQPLFPRIEVTSV